MPRVHRRQLREWLSQWQSDPQALTPKLGDQVVGVVPVDDARPLLRPTTGFRGVDWENSPAGGAGVHSGLAIRGLGNGVWVRDVTADANFVLRISTGLGAGPLGVGWTQVANRAIFTDPAFPGTNARFLQSLPRQDILYSTEHIRSQMEQWTTATANLPEYQWNLSTAIGRTFPREPIFLAAGYMLFIFNQTANAALDLTFDLEEVPQVT